MFGALKRRGAVLASFVVLGGLGVAGCGGGGDDEGSVSTVAPEAETTTSASVSLEEFIDEADGICAEANAAIANLAGAESSAPSSTAVTQELEITQGVESTLKAIGTPDDPGGEVSGFMTALRQQIRALKAQQQALASGDTTAAEIAASELASARNAAATAAADAGFEDCGGEGEVLSTDTTTGGSGSPDDPVSSDPAPADPTPAEPATPAEPSSPAPPSSGGTGTDPGGTAPGGGGGGGGGSSSSSGGIGPG